MSEHNGRHKYQLHALFWSDSAIMPEGERYRELANAITRALGREGQRFDFLGMTLLDRTDEVDVRHQRE